jgi:hypothetical protein
MRIGVAALAVALAGCGDDGTAADGGDSGADGGSADDGGDGSLGSGHGVVTIEFRRSENEATNPYAGTARVSITLAYLECLADFYAANPGWRQDGGDGAGVFMAAASDGLCAADPEHAECTVAQITQNVDVANALVVDYAITGELEDRRLRFGPLPTEMLAACPDATSPTVRIGSNGAIRGTDATGAVFWETKSFSPDTVKTDQGQPLTIRAGAPG